MKLDNDKSLTVAKRNVVQKDSPAEDASKMRDPTYLMLRRNKKLLASIKSLQSTFLLTFHENGVRSLELRGPEDEIAQLMLDFDSNPIYFLMVRDFIKADGRVYKIAKQLGKVLENADFDAKVSSIPYPMDAWIEFPDDVEFPISYGNAVTSILVHSREHWVGFVALAGDYVRFSFVGRSCGRISDAGMVDSGAILHIPECFQYAVNCAHYISSGNPDLRDWRPDTPKKVKGLARSGEHAVTIPITLVGFDFKESCLS